MATKFGLGGEIQSPTGLFKLSVVGWLLWLLCSITVHLSISSDTLRRRIFSRSWSRMAFVIPTTPVHLVSTHLCCYAFCFIARHCRPPHQQNIAEWIVYQNNLHGAYRERTSGKHCTVFPAGALPDNNSGQVVNIHAPPEYIRFSPLYSSASSTSWRLLGGLCFQVCRPWVKMSSQACTIIPCQRTFSSGRCQGSWAILFWLGFITDRCSHFIIYCRGPSLSSCRCSYPGWLGSVVVGCPISDRKITGSTSGWCIAG